jgi:preprotein translocase subunit SecD
VTLTLPGIAGIMLSTGSALDANILVFERLKEELRGGRVIRQAFDQAWSRAWPSIRDSNIAALITAAILFWFGNTFGATIVKGFSLTLAIGVVISLFSSLYITRTLLALALDRFKPTNLERWFGI